MAVASGSAGLVLAGPVFSSSVQHGFTLVGGHVMGERDMHVWIHKFYLSCSAAAIELYLSCVAISQDIPHQQRDFNFPKHSFGQNKVVMHSFQPTWFSQWPFLHYCKAQDVIYYLHLYGSFPAKAHIPKRCADLTFVLNNESCNIKFVYT